MDVDASRLKEPSYRENVARQFVGVLTLLQVDGEVFRMLAKRRGLPFGANGEILAEKTYQREALAKIVRNYGQPADESTVKV